MNIATPDAVLSFWFEPAPTDEASAEVQVRRWFQGGPAFDAEVGHHFVFTIEAALLGQLDDWAGTMRGRLALIIVLDQLTRHAYRNAPAMYAGDHAAQRLAVEGLLDVAGLQELDFPQRLFLCTPLLHAEDLRLQEQFEAIARGLFDEAPALYRPLAAAALEQAPRYLAVIRRFGRFPHRNALLDRPSTPEELEFLADWAEPKGAAQ